jgi:hypothetical protein
MKNFVLSILSVFMVSGAMLHAEAPTYDSVTKLYVATFNRAPDSAGLEYWLNGSGLQLEQISQSFFDQPETQKLYPSSTSNREFIKSVYSNLFNRDPDSVGLDYWESELNSGRIPKSVFILAVINGAQGTDATILEKKKNVGIAYVESGSNDLDLARSVMLDLSVDPVGSNNETYVDNHGDIVPVLSEKPDVLDIDIDDGDDLTIRIMRNINLNSEFSKSALSSYSAPNEIITYNYINVAVDIDVKCEDYGFDQSDLSFSKTLENGIKVKLYSKKEYLDNTHYYNIFCEESDFESVPSYSGLAGEYTIIQSDIWRK